MVPQGAGDDGSSGTPGSGHWVTTERADSGSRPPQLLEENVHPEQLGGAGNAQVDDPNLMAKEPGYSLTHYPPSFDSTITDSTVKEVDPSEPAILTVVAGKRTPLTDGMLKLLNEERTPSKVTDWIAAPDFVIKGICLGPPTDRSRSKSYATCDSSAWSQVPFPPPSNGDGVIGIGAWSDDHAYPVFFQDPSEISDVESCVYQIKTWE